MDPIRDMHTLITASGDDTNPIGVFVEIVDSAISHIFTNSRIITSVDRKLWRDSRSMLLNGFIILIIKAYYSNFGLLFDYRKTYLHLIVYF